MAIIATIRAPNGVTVNIHDDCMAARGSTEERRIIEAQRMAAYNILKGWGEKHDRSQEPTYGDDQRRRVSAPA